MAKKAKPVSFIKNVTRETKENLDSAREKIVEAKDKTESLIKKHPLTAVAIAAAVGAIVALGVNALTNREKPLMRRFKDYLY